MLTAVLLEEEVSWGEPSAGFAFGGPGAFVVTIKDRDKFKEAIRTKLLLEVAGRTPERPVVPAAAASKEPRVNCMIGEKIWQDRWGR